MTVELLALLIIGAIVSVGMVLLVLRQLSNLQHELKVLREDFSALTTRTFEMTSSQSKQLREEVNTQFKSNNDALLSRMSDIASLQKNQLDTFSNHLKNLTESNVNRFDKLNESVDKQLKGLREENTTKLEQMRHTVDEKLHATLEQRLGQSFKLVSERLELVHKGLGEMQTLASGVGDLKRVLTNVKTRGTWGEIRLEALLEQLFNPDQYEKNVRIKPKTQDFVEFALKLPGKTLDDAHVWLPIDAKFPQDYFESLLKAQEAGQKEAIEAAEKALESRIKSEAKSLSDKYIDPPTTTDFGIMFLPVESLYAEVLRRPGLHQELQHKYRILVAGPTTLAALLNSLQMGFRTLAIEKRSSEVWSLLAVVKTEFGKFGDILEKTQKKLQEAGNTMDLAARKSRTIERKLRKVEELPEESSSEDLIFEPLEQVSLLD